MEVGEPGAGGHIAANLIGDDDVVVVVVVIVVVVVVVVWQVVWILPDSHLSLVGGHR